MRVTCQLDYTIGTDEKKKEKGKAFTHEYTNSHAKAREKFDNGNF